MGHVILHVEDDQQIRDIVKLAFESFGFSGRILAAGSVKEALTLLSDRAEQLEPLNLILVDMKLPDGEGLDVIREVKSDPYWKKTPLVVLSGEDSSQIINDSYALGANCFFPKIPGNKNVLDSLKKLYGCWLQGAVLPKDADHRDTYATCLTRAVHLRARTANYYSELAHVYDDDEEMMAFWLDRSLNEGNFTNLIVFFQGIMKGHGFSFSSIQRISEMQARVDACLRAAILDLKGDSRPSKEDIFGRVIELHEAWDEVCFFDIIRALLRQSPVAARALQRLVVEHLTRIGGFIAGRTAVPELNKRAIALYHLAGEIDVLEK